jgi:hypothetical protein
MAAAVRIEDPNADNHKHLIAYGSLFTRPRPNPDIEMTPSPHKELSRRASIFAGVRPCWRSLSP